MDRRSQTAESVAELIRLIQEAPEASLGEGVSLAALVLELNSGTPILEANAGLYEVFIPEGLRRRPLRELELEGIYSSLRSRLADDRNRSHAGPIVWAIRQGPSLLSMRTLQSLLTVPNLPAEAMVAVLEALVQELRSVVSDAPMTEQAREELRRDPTILLNGLEMVRPEGHVDQGRTGEILGLVLRLRELTQMVSQPDEMREVMSLTDKLRQGGNGIPWDSLRAWLRAHAWHPQQTIVLGMDDNEEAEATTVGLIGPQGQVVFLDFPDDGSAPPELRTDLGADDEEWRHRVRAGRKLRRRGSDDEDIL